MKKDEINTVVKNSFKQIDKSFQKIITDFEEEDIQEFRREIKKLKAFFLLLEMEGDGSADIKITRKMKIFYGYAGIIRNLQLHLKNIHAYFDHSNETIPQSYMAKLEKELESWKSNTKEYMDLHSNFLDDEEQLMALLPDKLREVSIKKFLHYILHEFKSALTRLEEDEALHSTRKFLEHIYYNWPRVEPEIGSFSTGLSRQEDVESLIEMLGAFRDKCYDVTLLQIYYNKSIEEEKTAFHKITHTWNMQKDELKKTICSRLESIPVNADMAQSFSEQQYN